MKKEKVGSSKVSKTAKASMGTKGGKGRSTFCPSHPDRVLIPARLFPPKGKPRAGWICGDTNIGKVTHYLNHDLTPWEV